LASVAATKMLISLTLVMAAMTPPLIGQTAWSSPDAMHRFVRELCAQPTEGRAAYVRGALQQIGVKVREQSFDTLLLSARDTLRLNGTNLIVRFGEGTPVTVVGGHLDAVPNSPGANDNAAAVAVMLALISEWRAEGAPGAVEVVFFDREENGRIGSDVYARTIDPASHRASINLDMVGMGDEVYVGPVGGGDDDRMLPALRKAADSLGLNAVFSGEFPDGDHESFARLGLENLSISVLPRGDAAKLSRLLKDGWSGKNEDMPRMLKTVHLPSDSPDLVEPASLALVLNFVRTAVVLLNTP
jgi:hypothetical protein